MIVSINQPAYLPWLGYFDRIARSDLHIVLDNIQIERNTSTSFTNRNKIRTPQGWTWLTIPIKTSKHSSQIINEIEMDNQKNWRRKHLASLKHSYSHTNFFVEYESWFTNFYQHEHQFLCPTLSNMTNFLLESLDINTKLIFSSDMNSKGNKSDLILNLCKEAGTTTYLSGPFGRDYLNLKDFENAGIQIEFHDYKHPIYHQSHGDFQPYMSIVDLLFNCGEKSKQFFSFDKI